MPTIAAATAAAKHAPDGRVTAVCDAPVKRAFEGRLSSRAGTAKAL